MSEIAKKILNKIEAEHIIPEPKWKFLLTNWFYWGAFAFTILLGGLASSVIFFIISASDWDIYYRLNFNLWSFIFLNLPYFWLVILAGFLLISVLNARHTRHGYRFPPLFIVGLSIILSLILGAGLYYARAGENIDYTLFEHYPLYGRVAGFHHVMWENPSSGLLIGKIITPGKGFLEINDRARQLWRIECSELCADPKSFSVGLPVRIIGSQIGERLFFAEEIRPGRLGSDAKIFRVKVRPPSP